jgi:hypothetical protein
MQTRNVSADGDYHKMRSHITIIRINLVTSVFRRFWLFLSQHPLNEVQHDHLLNTYLEENFGYIPSWQRGHVGYFAELMFVLSSFLPVDSSVADPFIHPELREQYHVAFLRMRLRFEGVVFLVMVAHM